MRISVIMAMLLLGACHKTSSTSSSSSSGGMDAAQPSDAGESSDAAVGYDHDLRDAGPGCGTITADGECQGNVLVYCDDTNNLAMSDCASRGRTCGLQPTLGGNWCLGQLGQTCLVNQVDVCVEGVQCLENVCGGLVDGGTGDSGSSASSSSGGGSSTLAGSSSGAVGSSSVMGSSSTAAPSSSPSSSSAGSSAAVSGNSSSQ